jgi:hypothetical protein
MVMDACEMDKMLSGEVELDGEQFIAQMRHAMLGNQKAPQVPAGMVGAMSAKLKQTA